MRKILYHPLVIAIITLLTGILCFSLYINSFQLKESSTKVSLLQADVEKHQKEANTLQQKLENAKSSTAKEGIIRDQLLMQKPGEFVVQLPDLPVSSPKHSSDAQSLSPWQEWQRLLFDRN